MPLRCKCCGVRGAQNAACFTCETPVKAHEETYAPEMYEEPLAIVVQALLFVIRGETARGIDLVSTWRSSGAKALKAQHFEGIAEITGIALGPAGRPIANASKAVEEWLMKGGNRHAPATYALLYERYFIERTWDDAEQLSDLGLLEATGLRGHNATLSERPSEAADKREVASAQGTLELLAEMEGRTGGVAPPAEAASVGVLRWMCESTLAGAPFCHHQYALDQMDGAHVNLQVRHLPTISPDLPTISHDLPHLPRLPPFLPSPTTTHLVPPPLTTSHVH